MSEINRALVTENRLLLKQVRELEARLRAMEASRWWRLHPRFFARRLRESAPAAGLPHADHAAPPARTLVSDPQLTRFNEEVVAHGQFSGSWFMNEVAHWEPILGDLENRQARILEIGSFEGLSACYLLWRLHDATITCIDTFEGILDPTVPAVDRSQLEATFDANLALVGASRVRKLVGDSRRCLLDLLAEVPRFDLAYVDGSHLGLDVLVDAALVWPLVKSGGTIVFDDYGWRDLGEDALLRPGPAIDAFRTLVDRKHELVFSAHQIALRKLA